MDAMESTAAAAGPAPVAPGLELMRRGGGGSSGGSSSSGAPPGGQAHPQPPPLYRTVAKLRGVGLRYINGVASSYGVPHPYPAAALEPRGVSEAAFAQALDRVNNALLMYWPCAACFLCGYVCSPCTLGLSLGGPRVCVAEAEKYARFELDCLNGSALFRTAGMRWELRRTCLRSWIEVQLLEGQDQGQGQGQEGGGSAAAAVAAAATASNQGQEHLRPL